MIGTLLAMMGGAGYLAYRGIEEASWNIDHSNNGEMELDVNAMSRDNTSVLCGRLSKSEYRRRCKTGYYMIPKKKIEKEDAVSWYEKNRVVREEIEENMRKKKDGDNSFC